MKAPKNRIVVVVENGMVQDVFFNRAADDTVYLVVDKDTDGGNVEDITEMDDGKLAWISGTQDVYSFEVLEPKVARAFEE